MTSMFLTDYRQFINCAILLRLITYKFRHEHSQAKKKHEISEIIS